jgi:amino acid adenylation domain-containing protein
MRKHGDTYQENLGAATVVAQANSLTELFTRVVQQRGEALAIVSRDERWTYSRLAYEAGRIAALIQGQCGLENDLVALLLRHDASMVAAILGALGAGKCYVPLSIEDPAQRLQDILNESGCAALLAGSGLEALAQSIHQSGPVLKALEAPADPAAFCARSPHDIAYLLYTSGTTGRPKGVFQCDRNVLNHAASYAASIRLACDDRMTLFSSYGFDAAVMDIFATLLSGATLCIWDVRRDGIEGLRSWVAEHDVTIWHSTPSLLRAAFPAFPEPAKLRWVVLGGEAATSADLDLTLRHAGPGCRLLNGLGPTECTTALQYVADAELDRNSHRLAVGRPVLGTDVILLDPAGEVTDICGELAIRRQHIALGYWRRPSLTAERFVPSRDGYGERIYRTGDIARWRADGNLEFLGRSDDQIKIRGFRVELNEVEAAIRSHDAVLQAVVIVREDEPSARKRLVGYVVFRLQPTPPKLRELRSYLARKIADYMIPSAIVILEAIPLLANGKVNRRALPAPEARPEIGAYVSPETEIEMALADIWAEILLLDQVGVEDDFFELGGDSLEGARIVARIRSKLQIDLPLSALFNAPTVAGLARMLEAGA